MDGVIIPKNKITETVGILMNKYRVVAPARENGALVFKELADPEEIVLNDEPAYKSPKEFLFPQAEEILAFDEKGNVAADGDIPETILLGVRPCDLEALKVLTAVFINGKFTDVYFEKRLNSTILIGLGCISEKPGCFCEERGICKDSSGACDIFLTANEEGYAAEIISDKGRKLLDELNAGGLNFYAPVKGANAGFLEKDACAYGDKAPHEILEITGDEKSVFDNTDWGRISERCIGCGTCAYICPTCHCFEFYDAANKGRTARYRRWDSCMYPKFTLHASGHNPRPSKKERYRQRIMHKYVYVKHNFGYVACTGCGRCVRSCPAGMDIKAVVKGIMEGTWKIK